MIQRDDSDKYQLKVEPVFNQKDDSPMYHKTIDSPRNPSPGPMKISKTEIS